MVSSTDNIFYSTLESYLSSKYKWLKFLNFNNVKKNRNEVKGLL